MAILTLAEIDAELRFRVEECARITATLVELDRHPGLTLIRSFPPAGATEAAWLPVREALELMWQDHGRLRAILEAAESARGARARVDDAARAELTRLLRGRPHEVSRVPIPMARRSLTGPGEQVLMVGLADVVDRMKATFPRIAEFLDAVDAVNTRILSGLAPIQHRLDAAGPLGGGTSAVESGIAALLRDSATDPLALRPEDIDARIGELDAALRREAALLAEAAAMRADWPAALAHTRAQWESLREAVDRVERIRAEVTAKIEVDALPAPRTVDPALAGRVDALEPGAVAALIAVRAEIAAAAERASAEADLYQGLLDRRAELRGRLRAYRAKADRLGVAALDAVAAAERAAGQVLGARPCDLAAATRAVAEYRRLIAATSGRTS
ncbi:hypothetical protein ACWEKT_15925 [Nocardia takedensis]